MIKTIIDILKKINSIYDSRQKVKFCFLFFAILLSGCLELLGISLVLPFINVVMNPSSITSSAFLNNIYAFLNMESANQFLILLALFLIFVYILKNMYMMTVYYFQYKILFNSQKKMSLQLIKFYLNHPYSYHLNINTSELVRTITQDTLNCSSFLTNLFFLLTELIVLVLVVCFLFFVNKLMTIALIVLFIIAFFGLFRKLKNKLKSVSLDNQKYHGQMIKWIQQSLGAIKDIKTLGKEQLFIRKYYENLIKFSSAQKYFNFLQQIPRLFIETVVVSIVLLMIILLLSRGMNALTIITQIAVFAMASFRLMPSMNRMHVALSAMIYYKPSLDIIYKDLKKTVNSEVFKEEENKEINLKYGISVQNVSYKYPNTEKMILNRISLDIKYGQSVAFIGQTGAGKTTIVDLILGLLLPTEGKIMVGDVEIHKNRKNWSAKIGYVPQYIFLVDDSIRNNINFYNNSAVIDDERTWKAAEQAQLKDFIESLPQGLDTIVGERGIRLSGGQRQRIGIARALYNKPELLVLDEATSSLDNETEKAVIGAIDNLYGKITMIVVAHRLTTIEKCDVIYKLNNGEITK
ncbi:MAG: ABC transporter ATP-binding protein [Endomicrobiaceae bacterium]